MLCLLAISQCYSGCHESTNGLNAVRFMERCICLSKPTTIHMFDKVSSHECNFPLVPGLCDWPVTYPGHDVLTETLNIPFGPDHYSAMKHDFRLTPATTLVQPDPTTSSVTSLIQEGDAAVITSAWFGLVVGFSLVVPLLIEWSHKEPTACKIAKKRKVISTRGFWLLDNKRV